MKNDRLGWIRNPMTIIALFVGLTELALSIVFSNSPSNVQPIILAFIVIFPSLCAIAFYLILWFRPQNFYGPSDYRSDKTYVTMNKAVQKTAEIVQATPHREFKALEVDSQTNIQTVVEHLSEPICWYLLRASKADMTPDEHIDVMAQHLDQIVADFPEFPQLAKLGNRFYAIGYINCAWASYTDVLFKSEGTNEKFRIQIPPEIVTLISKKLGLA